MLIDGGGGGGEDIGKLIGARLNRGLPLRKTGDCPDPGRYGAYSQDIAGFSYAQKETDCH